MEQYNNLEHLWRAVKGNYAEEKTPLPENLLSPRGMEMADEAASALTMDDLQNLLENGEMPADKRCHHIISAMFEEIQNGV